MNIKTFIKGKAIEHIVEGKLALQGYTIYPVMTESDCGDAIIEKEGKLEKIQIKMMRYKGSKNIKSLDLEVGGAHKYKYKNTNVDILIGYDMENDIVYMVPKRYFRKLNTCSVSETELKKRGYFLKENMEEIE